MPTGKRVIGCKWMYKFKYKNILEVERFKTRLVAKSCIQQEGLNYQETFSLVVKIVTVGCVLAIVAIKHWIINQMNVYNAFLQGNLDKDVYMTLSQGFHSSNGPQQVCKLVKSLYGPKLLPCCPMVLLKVIWVVLYLLENLMENWSLFWSM